MKTKILSICIIAGSLLFTSCDSDDDNGNINNNSRAELYATSVSNGDLTVYDFANNAQVSTLTTTSTSNEGIQYDGDTDELFVASRSSLQLNGYSNVESFLTGGTSVVTGINASVDFTSPRALVVKDNFVVVADNGSNTFFVYSRTANGLTLRNQLDANFAVWGVEFVGNDLYAVVDQTGDLAIFNDFLANVNSGTIAADKTITIEGIVRTHGIAYDAADDVLIMTDIGAAAGAGSDTDGGFHVINNATSNIAAVADGGTLAIAGIQTRVAGAATLMGNPVDVTYDTTTNTVIIAEIANGGGRILGFNNIGTGGDINPAINNTLAGASSVDFYLEN